MIAVEPASLGFSTALLLGLSFGAGPCNIACLPYLGPVFMATGGGIAASWPILLPFSLGRITGYTLLGAVAGGAGSLAQEWLDSPSIHWVLGGATIGVALSLFLRRQHSRHATSCERRGRRSGETFPACAPPTTNPMPATLFAMGLGMTFNPCVPLTTILLASAATASIPSGVSLGAGFGMGAVAIPTMVFALGVAHFSNQVRLHLHQWRGVLEMASIFLLLLMGTATIMGWLRP